MTGNPGALDVHLALVERDVAVAGNQIKIHCHCLTLDANGKVGVERLTEFMRHAIVDYAIPKSKIAEAKARDLQFNSTEAVSELFDRAKRSFTDLAKTGEGGEMLLFLLAERFLKLPQILCKMDLKTDGRMHYHGADGVYATVAPQGHLKLYWGESKIYKSASTAIRDCLASLAPFLTETDHDGAARDRDLLLLSDKADLSNTKLTDALKAYFDKSSVLSKKVEYCGVALVGFDASFYPTGGAKGVAKQIADASRAELLSWSKHIETRLKTEKLQHIDIQMLCIPLPSAEGFRKAFLRALGLKP